MIQLSEATNGRVNINGQPYQRGLLQVRYGLEGSVAIRDPFGAVMSGVPWQQFINPHTGAPFPSLAELKAFVDANFFRIPGQLNAGFPYSFPFTLS